MAELRVIKKYPNRRLYDTQRSRYIVLSDIRTLVRDGKEVQVVDSQHGGDITRGVLLQIIAERETGPDRCLSNDMMLEWIRCHAIRKDAFIAQAEYSPTTMAGASVPEAGGAPVSGSHNATFRPASLWRESAQNLDIGSKDP